MRSARAGFTLVEMLVVMTIIAVMVGMLLPAVSQVQDTARTTQCKNNLKQVCYSFMLHHDAFAELPPNNHAANWGPMTHILPFCEEATVFAKVDFGQPLNEWTMANVLHHQIKMFVCPSQPNDFAMVIDRWVNNGQTLGYATYGITHYAVSGGPNCSEEYKTGTAGPAGDEGTSPLIVTGGALALTPNKVSHDMSDIKDGWSNTLLLGELPKAAPRDWVALDFVDEFPVPNVRHNKATTASTYKALNSQAVHTFGSEHGGNGGNFCMCDGSVRFLRTNIDLTLYRGLSTRDAGELVRLDD